MAKIWCTKKVEFGGCRCSWAHEYENIWKLPNRMLFSKETTKPIFNDVICWSTFQLTHSLFLTPPIINLFGTHRIYVHFGISAVPSIGFNLINFLHIFLIILTYLVTFDIDQCFQVFQYVIIGKLGDIDFGATLGFWKKISTY